MMVWLPPYEMTATISFQSTFFQLYSEGFIEAGGKDQRGGE